MDLLIACHTASGDLGDDLGDDLDDLGDDDLGNNKAEILGRRANVSLGNMQCVAIRSVRSSSRM